MMRISILGIVVMLLPAAAGLPRAAAQPSTPAGPQIQSVTHDARTPLPAGRRLTVRLRGTPGGKARFHIAGVVSGLAMRESPSADRQTSTYLGTYEVRPGDAVPLAAVTATLLVGDQEITAVGDRALSIDTRPPVVATPLPEPGAHLTNLRPNIVVRFYDGESSVDPGGVTLLINGLDVTPRTAITPAFASYTPERAFQPGPVAVQVAVRDRAGNASRVRWSFTVGRPQGLITSVTVSSATGLKPGDYLTVVVAGATRGQATFAVGAGAHSLPMTESPGAPGTYVGMYPIGFKHQGSLMRVTARLRKGARSSTATAVAAVPVMGRTPRPSIARPEVELAADDRTLQRVRLNGRAQPGYHVVALLSSRMESSRGGAWTPLLAGSAAAQQDGTWRMTLGPVLPRLRAALFVTVVVIDPLGQRSPPVTAALGGATGPGDTAAPSIPPGSSPSPVPAVQPSSTQQAPAAPPVPSTQQAPVTPSPPSVQPAPSTPPAQPAPSQQPAPAPRRPQCPPGQVLDPKTNECVATQQDPAAGEPQGGGSSGSPPANPPQEQTPAPGPDPSDPKPKDPPNGPKNPGGPKG